MVANKDIIRQCWATGADLNTSSREIHSLIQEATTLPHGFVCVASLLCEQYGYPNNTTSFLEDIHAPLTEWFNLANGAAGYSAAICIEKLRLGYPNVIIQGLGRVGGALAYYIEKKQLGKIVGVIEKDYFIYGKNGGNKKVGLLKIRY